MSHLVDADTLFRLHENMSQEEYRGYTNIISFTPLSTLLSRSPAHMREELMNPPDPTPAMIKGTAVHAAILEREEFHQRFAKAPAVDRRTKEGKAIYGEFQALNVGKTCLDAETYEACERMAQAVDRHPVAGKLLSGGRAEVSGFWRDPETGVLCKCRPDYLKRDMIIDVKTADDASFRGFQRKLVGFNYHLQSAFYLDGLKTILGEFQSNDFVHIVVEKEPPYAVAVYVLDDASLDRARVDIRKGLKTYQECVESGRWPAYPNEIVTMNLPSWAWMETE